MPPQREWFDTDYYAVLGVSKTASDKEITKAYRKLARKHHPDASDGDEERFKRISSAYAVVGNPEKRAEYDEARRLGAGAFAGSASGGHASGPSSFTYTTTGDVGDLGDIRDIFANLFGGAGRGGPGGGPTANFPMQGVDLESHHNLSFRDAINGITTTIPVSRNPNTPPLQVKVRIPPGVNDGQRIRLPGKGGSGRNGGPNGDLYVVVQVKPDPRFGRKGLHLTTKATITYPQAVLGTDLKVSTFDGGTVTLKVPAGTESGATFRVKGRGVKTKRGTGDLLVTAEIKVPKKPSKAERQLIEQLGQLDPASRNGTTNSSKRSSNRRNSTRRASTGAAKEDPNA